ncbi:MAG: xanthine dehydrogenase family protein molybdopterin-binding subunit, partial [Alphaproteobacteria bacterium]|nr:xanthine dehydrogenase family protein molybdopterin-binding subunit [Alphaproteobacteria bacterium]
MEKFGKSQPITRVEDQRFLTGQGRYVDDIAPAGALFAVFVRAQVGHGVLTGIDADDARAAPGVHAVLTAEDLLAAGMVLDLAGAQIKTRDGGKGAHTRRPILAQDRVRHVGDPLACVIAETLSQARDAAEAVVAWIEDLPAKIDVAPGGAMLHETAPDNVAFDYGLGDAAAVDAAIAAAAHVVQVQVTD